MTKKERLEALIAHYSDGKPTRFAKLIGVAPSTISTWLARDTFDYDLLFAKCEKISPGWLLTGNGPMLKSAEPIDTYKPLSGPTPPAVEVKPIHQPRSVERKVGEQVVYLYDFEATAGLKALFDNNRQNIIDTIKIPNLPKCDGAIHIVGDSMYPILKSGDIILYKQMPPGIENLLYGEMYLLSYDIDGDDYVVVKYIRKSDKGEPFVTLASENPEHAARDIDFRRITALALVKASVRINCIT